MRNITVILLFIFFIPPINAEWIETNIVDDIRLLNPDEQVHAIIETFKHYDMYTRLITFTYCCNLLTENPEGVKPVLFRYLKESNPRPVNDLSNDLSGMTYRIIDNIIWDDFYFRNRLFTRDEEELLAELYQEKLDYYLKTYKRIDRIVYHLDDFIAYLRTG
jgi:hypothetical protein